MGRWRRWRRGWCMVGHALHLAFCRPEFHVKVTAWPILTLLRGATGPRSQRLITTSTSRSFQVHTHRRALRTGTVRAPTWRCQDAPVTEQKCRGTQVSNLRDLIVAPQTLKPKPMRDSAIIQTDEVSALSPLRPRGRPSIVPSPCQCPKRSSALFVVRVSNWSSTPV